MSKDVSSSVLPYVAPKQVLVQKLNGYTIDTYESGNIIAFYDTDDRVGLFSTSDMICKYDENDMPIMITERLRRCNFSSQYWDKVKNSLLAKARTVNSELGFITCVTIEQDYIDYIHYKQHMVNIAQGT